MATAVEVVPVREYETVFILHPKVDEAGIENEIAAVKKIIADGKGELVGVQKWGRRKLAYKIRKAYEGFYVLVRFKSGPDVLKELDRIFRLNEMVLRNLTILSAGGPFPPDLRGRERRGHRGEGLGARDRRGGFGGRPRGRGEEGAREKRAETPAPDDSDKPPEASGSETANTEPTGPEQAEHTAGVSAPAAEPDTVSPAE